MTNDVIRGLVILQGQGSRLITVASWTVDRGPSHRGPSHTGYFGGVSYEIFFIVGPILCLRGFYIQNPTRGTKCTMIFVSKKPNEAG
jgi:hypothetical protein